MKKATPNLPSSSRMQMPSGGSGMSSKMKSAGAKKGGTTKKVMASASKKSMATKKSY